MMPEPQHRPQRLFAVDRNHPLFDSGSIKVSIFAGLVIVFSMLFIGIVVYLLTENEAVKKLKTKDLTFIAESVASRIDAKIGRAVETSLVLASDPETKRWVAGGETDRSLEDSVLERIDLLVREFGYSSSFVVSTITRNYWAENKRLLSKISESNEHDAWFFDVLRKNEPVIVMLDYNAERKDTFVFVDALMRDNGSTIAAVGVGLSLQDLSQSFKDYKYGPNSSLWLIDQEGTIYLSDELERNGKNIREFLPERVHASVMKHMDDQSMQMDFTRPDGERFDLISYPLETSEWHLVIQIPRRETVGFLNTIKINTAIVMLVSLVSIVFFFFYVSRKLANPYQRALRINEELEKQIAARTKELAEQNEHIMDSITYAQRIQESILPDKEQMNALLSGHFVLWKPRDLVGGDFYWVKEIPGGCLVAVGDCTGHGVPGAFMTMLTVSTLNHIVDRAALQDPAAILSELNRVIKRTLHQETEDGLTDDGLDLGICAIVGNRLVYSGAGCNLYVRGEDGVAVLNGDRRRVGYRRTPADQTYVNQTLTLGANDTLYMTTDGMPDQNGGPQNYSFGRKRFVAFLEAHASLPLPEQANRLGRELAAYMGGEPQRDDITVLGFRARCVQ